mmetsp:Transcript_13977/g.11940  ORF Transcript_13977/g.11940 Transcript_13977/m.11940 type:complete len:106 (+) Transcript_13977:361-678(+)
MKKEVLLQGKRNSNGMPYDPITLAYHEDKQGNELKNRDEEAKVRAYLRATNLDARSNCGYNLLTGENRQEVNISEDLQSKYKNKIDDAYSKNNIKSYNNSQNKFY